MTQKDLFNIALAQSAIDLSCTPEELVSGKKVVVESLPHPKARAYLRLPFACNLVSYGGGVVASVSPEVRDIVTHYIEKYPTEHLFETPNLHALDDALAPHGLRTCFMAEYFLPDLSALRPLPCKYRLRLLGPADFTELYLPQWSNALSDKRPHLDVLGVGAYDGDTLIGTLTESGVGIYEMKDMRYGHYLIKETVAPDGFFLDEGVYAVFVETNGTT